MPRYTERNIRKLSFQQLESRELLSVSALDDTFLVEEGADLVVGERHFSPVDLQQTQTIELNHFTYKFAVDEEHQLAVTLSFWHIYIVDMNDGFIMSTIDSISDVSDFSISEDGKYVFVAEYGPPRIHPSSTPKSRVHRYDVDQNTWITFPLAMPANEIEALSGTRLVVNAVDRDYRNRRLSLVELVPESATARTIDDTGVFSGPMFLDRSVGLLYSLADIELVVYRIKDDSIAEIQSATHIFDDSFGFASSEDGGEWLFARERQFEAVDPSRRIRDYPTEIVFSTSDFALGKDGTFYDPRSGLLIGQLDRAFSRRLYPGINGFWHGGGQLVKNEIVWEPQGVLVNDTGPVNLSAELESKPLHGTVELYASGAFRYSPSSGFVGVDRFSYRAMDQKGNASTANVEIQVLPSSQTNSPPQIDDLNFAIDQNGKLEITENFGDVSAGQRHLRDIEDIFNVSQLESSPNFDRLALRNTATRIQILDSESGEVVSEAFAHNIFADMSITPEGRYLFALDRAVSRSAEAATHIHRYDFQNDAWEVEELPMYATSIHAVSSNRVIIDQGILVSFGAPSATILDTIPNEINAKSLIYDGISNQILGIRRGPQQMSELVKYRVGHNALEYAGRKEVSIFDGLSQYHWRLGISTDSRHLFWGRFVFDAMSGRVLHELEEEVLAVTDELVFGEHDVFDLVSGVRIDVQNFVSSGIAAADDGNSYWSYNYDAMRLEHISLDGKRIGLLGRAFDSDGDSVSFQLIETTHHGLLREGTNSGELFYEPHRDFLGADHFVFELDDGKQTSGPFTATIHIHDPKPLDLPPLGASDHYTVQAGEILSVGTWEIPTLSLSEFDQTFEQPFSIAVSESFDFLAISNRHGISIHSLRTKERISTYEATQSPAYLRFSPDRRYLFARSKDRLHRYDSVHNTWVTKVAESLRDFEPISGNLVLANLNALNISFLEFPKSPIAHLRVTFQDVDAHSFQYDSASSELYVNLFSDLYVYIVSGNLLIPSSHHEDFFFPWGSNFLITKNNFFVNRAKIPRDGSDQQIYPSQILGASATLAISHYAVFDSSTAEPILNIRPGVAPPISNRSGTRLYGIEDSNLNIYSVNANSTGVLVNDKDPAGDTLRAEIISSPAYGTLKLYPNGAFQYVPRLGFSGEDQFQYRVLSGDTWSSPVPVTIDVQGSWHNFFFPLDVNQDQTVTPIDALAVIFALNQPTEVYALWAEKQSTWKLDVNNDQFVSPIDALIIINALNRIGESEPEPPGAPKADFDFYFEDLARSAEWHKRRFNPLS